MTKQPIVAEESVAEIWADMQELLVEHYEEIAHDKAAIPLAPSRIRYDTMELRGELLVLGCRLDGRLIGYSVFFVNRHIHYRNTLVAVNDVLFVTKPMRARRAGLLLILESEKRLRLRDVVKVVWHIKPENDWSAVLLHRGYKPLETCYGKLL